VDTLITIGVMSGTSCDGVDALALRLGSLVDPHEPVVLGHAHEPFPAALRDELLRPEALTAPRLAELHYLLPEIYARVVRRLPGHDAAACCGMHGQTIWHRPPSKNPEVAATLQIGSSAVLAHRLGIPVVGDLRGADVALGGEGAPIVPFCHWFFTPPAHKPRLVVNFGGIANLTLVTDDASRVRGYDVGPGMMISDAHAAIATRGEQSCDRDGELSARGSIVPELVDAILAHPFLDRSPPKSTGREDFGERFFRPILERFGACSRADVARSILAATAGALRGAVERDPEALEAREVVLTGGGARNPTLVRLVEERFREMKVIVAREGVLAPDHHEPASVALIAARTFAGLPSSLPGVTGARRAARLGHVHWP
jgi:anhydro-N-acetylmuramic acid kinase